MSNLIIISSPRHTFARYRLLCLAALIAAAWFWSPKLSYWWDEFSLVQAHSSPYGGIFYSHMGHFFPIGRLAFYLEENIFGDMYLWMVCINIVIFYWALIIFQMPLLRTNCVSTKMRILVNFLLAPSLFLSIGIWYDLQWAMQICWFLSIFFASLAFLSLRLTRLRKQLFMCTFLLSWLSLSSNIIGVAFLVVALGFWSNTLKKIEALTVLGLSGILTLIGSRIAEMNPPIDPLAAGWPIDFQNVINNAWEILLIGSATLTTWLVTPLGIFLPSSEALFTAFGKEVLEHQVINLIVVAALFMGLLCRVLIRKFETQSLASLTFLVGMLMTALLVVASRFGNTQSYLHIRYAPIMQLLGVLFWVCTILTLEFSTKRFRRIFSRSLLFLFALTTAISFVRIESTIRDASYVGRRINTQLQLNELKSCDFSNTIAVYPEIQPSISSGTMCEIALTVRGLTD